MWHRILVVAVLVLGCGSKKSGPTAAEIMDKYRAQVQALDTKIRSLKDAFPADAELTPGKLDPPLVFGERATGSNTIVLMHESLGDPVKQDVTEIPPSDLHFAIGWLTTLPINSKDNSSMEETVSRAANTRYLVVVRNQDKVAPEMLDKSTYRRGTTTTRLYVYDLKADKLLGAIKIVASTPEKVEYTDSAIERDRAMKALVWALEDDRKAKLNKAMQSLGNVKWGY